jgi:hypothetical protein
MRPAAKPGFLLVAKRECRWLLHDRVALALIFGVPLFDRSGLMSNMNRSIRTLSMGLGDFFAII